MKRAAFLILAIIFVAGCSGRQINWRQKSEGVKAMEFEGVKIEPKGHATVRIEKGAVIYIDPYNIKEKEGADIILITHSHYDHCSIADIQKLVKQDTVIATVADCQSKLSSVLSQVADMKLVEPGSKLEINGVKIEAVAAYNINKKFHPKDYYWVGFIVTIGGKRIYHAGDTDLIPEMGSIKADVALLPIGGTYTMDAKEAAEAANRINAKLTIPIHYGGIVGTREDAEVFKKLVKGRVEII